jgi:ribosomal protein L23
MAKDTTEKKIEAVLKSVLLKLRQTEKTALSAESRGVYAFNVGIEATKQQILAALKDEHKVVPEKIRLLAVPSKRVFRRGKWGVKSGGKKAYVYLKKGDKLNVA